MTADLIRYLAITDLIVIVLCAGLVGVAYRPHTPGPMALVSALQNAALVVVGVAIGVNVVATLPVTPGLITIAIVLAPVAIAFIAVAVTSLRRRLAT